MGQLATDSFTRADAGTLGANWTKLTGFSDLRITSNGCKATTSGDCVDAYTGAGAVNVNQYSQCTHSAQEDGGPVVRANTTSTFYLFDVGTTTNVTLYKCVTTVFTNIGTVAGAATPVSGDTLYVEVQGTTLVTKQNGVTRHNLSDSAINGTTVGGPYPGLHCFNTSLVLDDFAMGDFAAAGTELLPKMMQYSG